MLTLWGNRERRSAPLSQQGIVFAGGRTGTGRAGTGRRPAAASPAGRPGTAPGRDHGLPGRRAQPYRHVRSQARGSSEFRGELRPIKTNVPGFDICEHLPLQAKIADKLALVRNLQFFEPMQHELEEVYTGFPKSAMRPTFGSVVSRFRGGDRSVPPSRQPGSTAQASPAHFQSDGG